MESISQRLEQAQRAINGGSPEDAEQELLDVLEYDTDPRAQHLLGLARMRAGRPAEAAAVLEQARASRPQDPRIATHLGVCRIRSGDPAAAYPVLKEAMKLDPEHGMAFVNAATAALSLDKLDVAKACAERAHKLLPAEPAALLILGQVAQKRQRLEEATKYYRHALELEPDSEQGQEVLAGVLIRRGETAEAAVLYRGLLERQPTFTRHYNYASALLQEGDLAEAHAQNLEAARLFLEGAVPEREPDPRPYMPVDGARRALLSAHRAFGELGVPFLLIGGTLLGPYRDGGLIAHDKDVDLGLPWRVPRLKLIEALEAYHFVCPRKEKVRNGESGEYLISVVHAPSRVTVDLFFVRNDGDRMCWGFDHPAGPLLWSFTPFGRTTLDLFGERFEIPDPPERFLAELFGEDWTERKVVFDTVLKAPNLIDEARELGRAYGFNRLLDHINRQAWDRALGYCQMLREQRDEPPLEALEDELRRRERAAES